MGSMKKIILFAILFCAVCKSVVLAQVTLTFTGKDNLDNYVQLHHVVVENITRDWTDTLYYPDTILITSGVGLSDYESVSKFSVSQNVPNPFSGVTDFTMTLPYESSVCIEVFDMSGRQVTGKELRLYAGTHTFRVWLNVPQSYLLTVKTSHDAASIKMLNNSNGGRNHIEYRNTEPLTYELRSRMNSHHPFEPGDVMRYVGYFLNDSMLYSSAVIEQVQNSDEDFELEFHLWGFVELDGHFYDTTTLFIPDGTPCDGTCLGTMNFEVSGYPSNRTVQSVEDLRYLRMKMEHSWLGDLWISLACPNGQSATVLRLYNYNSTSNCTNQIPTEDRGWQQEGKAKAKLGQFYKPDGNDKCDPANNPMGTCWNYCWSCDTTSGYVYTCGSAYVYDTCNLFVSGSDFIVDSTDMQLMTNLFHPDESFSSLIGCPLNGLWQIRIIDGYSLDNGYVEEAELALAPDSAWHLASLSVVTSGSASAISFYSAVCDGNVTYDGLLAVTERGICWDTLPEPTVMGHHAFDGQGEGHFSVPIDNLSAGTTYYYRAYAINALGVGYGTTRTFTTNPNVTPTVTTCNISNVTGESALATGILVSDGGLPILERGICWANNQAPSITDNVEYLTTTADTFSYEITGLSNNTNYCVRAFARNALGISYGAKKSFKTHYPPTANLALSDSTNVSVTVDLHVSTPIAVLSDGICWGTSPNPTINDTSITFSHPAGTNSYSHNHTATVTGLTPGVTYYIRGFAENIAGFTYSNELVVSTIPLPVVTTAPVVAINDTTAQGGGSIVIDSGLPLMEEGLCWNTSGNPTVADRHASSPAIFNPFDVLMENLSLDTIYHVRAYATNGYGTSYGNEIKFVTRMVYGTPCPGDTTVTDIDGNVYHTVQLGSQCWMKENMRTRRYTDSTDIVLNNGCYYPAGDSANVTEYGYLYSLYVARQSKFCPAGWHLPSKDEWDTLNSYVGSQELYRCGGSSYNVAKALASTSGWTIGDYSSVGACAPAYEQLTNNETGFTAMPAGEVAYYLGDQGVTEENSDFHTEATFWSTTAKYIHVGNFTFLDGYYYFSISNNGSGLYNHLGDASECHSARCIKN